MTRLVLFLFLFHAFFATPALACASIDLKRCNYITVGNKTELTGAIIASGSYDEDGVFHDAGNLNLTTKELVYNDIKDFYKSESSAFGASTSFNIWEEKTTTEIKNQKIVGTNRQTQTMNPKGKTTITLKNVGEEKEQLTHATIGAGNITVGGSSDVDLAGLNRDVNNAQEITKDIITGALDGTIIIDNRLFTEEGRAEILNQQKNLWQNAKQAGKNASVAPITVAGILYGGLGVLLNHSNSSVEIQGNEIYFIGNALAPGGAINLGGAISYFGDYHPDDVGRIYNSNDNLILGDHESSHTPQWFEKGSIGFIYDWINNGGPTMTNPIEQAANQGARDKMKERGIYDILQDPKYRNVNIPGISTINSNK